MCDSRKVIVFDCKESDSPEAIRHLDQIDGIKRINRLTSAGYSHLHYWCLDPAELEAIIAKINADLAKLGYAMEQKGPFPA